MGSVWGCEGNPSLPLHQLILWLAASAKGVRKWVVEKGMSLLQLESASLCQFSSKILEREFTFPLPGGLHIVSGERVGVKVSFQCKFSTVLDFRQRNPSTICASSVFPCFGSTCRKKLCPVQNLSLPFCTSPPEFASFPCKEGLTSPTRTSCCQNNLSYSSPEGRKTTATLFVQMCSTVWLSQPKWTTCLKEKEELPRTE